VPRRPSLHVMPALGAGIHAFLPYGTSPDMTAGMVPSAI
jgi:hypothetical protein